MSLYPVPDNFFSESSKHCTALFIDTLKVGTQPDKTDLNATLTFVEFKNKVYGITCSHVASKENRPTFVTLTHSKRCIINEFFYPQHEIPTENHPDIAIRQIHPDFPQAVGKIPVKIQQQHFPDLGTIRHAVAVGYPTKEKQKVGVQNGYRIAMPCVHALAEISSINRDSGKLSLYSELDQTVQVKDFSGMSGGPVFWSTEKDYGLFGIIYEALPPNPPDNSLGGGPRINIQAELVMPERFKGWISQNPLLTEKVNWIKNINLNVHVF